MPCETQQQPDLRTVPAASQRSRKVSIAGRRRGRTPRSRRARAVKTVERRSSARAWARTSSELVDAVAEKLSRSAASSAKLKVPKDGGGADEARDPQARSGLLGVIVLGVIAAGVGGYILANQRLRFPVIEAKPFKLKAEFSTAQAVTPGQGQTVRVSGVRVGDIAKVELEDGRAIVTIDDRRRSTRTSSATDATALLRPKTGLKDMFIELDPGSARRPRARRAHDPDREHAARRQPRRDPRRARRRHARLPEAAVSGAGQGLQGRGDDLREVFRRFEPTHRDLAA